MEKMEQNLSYQRINTEKCSRTTGLMAHLLEHTHNLGDKNMTTKRVLEVNARPSLKDVNDDVQVQLEKAQSITDYIRRINNNQHAINQSLFKNDYLGGEIGKSDTALIILDEFIDKAIELLEKAN